jgi:hypothetical protein
MLVKRNGGMTEFIPSPREKREGLIGDHILELVDLLHARLCLIEDASGRMPEEAIRCNQIIYSIKKEEENACILNIKLQELKS